MGFRTIFFYARLTSGVAFCKIPSYFIATVKCQRTLWIVHAARVTLAEMPTMLGRSNIAAPNTALVIARSR